MIIILIMIIMMMIIMRMRMMIIMIIYNLSTNLVGCFELGVAGGADVGIQRAVENVGLDAGLELIRHEVIPLAVDLYNNVVFVYAFVYRVGCLFLFMFV